MPAEQGKGRAFAPMVFISSEALQKRFGEFFKEDVKTWRTSLDSELKRHLLPKEGGSIEIELPLGLLALKAGVKLEGKRIVATFELTTLFELPSAEPVKLEEPFAEVIDLKVVEKESFAVSEPPIVPPLVETVKAETAA